MPSFVQDMSRSAGVTLNAAAKFERKPAVLRNKDFMFARNLGWYLGNLRTGTECTGAFSNKFHSVSELKIVAAELSAATSKTMASWAWTVGYNKRGSTQAKRPAAPQSAFPQNVDLPLEYQRCRSCTSTTHHHHHHCSPPEA